MTLFLVPCGTSVITNLGERGPIAQLTRNALTGLAGQVNDGAAWEAGLVEDIVETVTEHLGQAQIWDQPEFLSAETSMLLREPDDSTGYLTPSEGDQTLILASDTGLGLVAAATVALLLGGCVNFHNGSGAEDPERVAEFEGLASGSRGGVDVVRIPHLDPRGAAGFPKAAEGIGRTLSWKLRALERPAVAAHLTGGYKATLPFLTGLLEHLPPALVGDVRAYCLFEMGEPIRLPVRSGDGGTWAGTLRRTLNEVSQGEDPQEHSWTGSMYVRTSHGWELTALGRAAHALHQDTL